MYDPAVGRFLQKDPAGFGDGPNLYLYAGNNPVNVVDPSGRGGVHLRGVRVDAGGHLRGGGAGGGGSTGAVWKDACTLSLLVFGAGALLTFLGLRYDAAGLAGNALQKLMTWQLGVWTVPLLYAMTSGDIWTFASAAFDMISWLFWNVLVPGLSWLDALNISLTAPGKITPLGWAVFLGGLVVQLAFLGMSLKSNQCI